MGDTIPTARYVITTAPKVIATGEVDEPGCINAKAVDQLRQAIERLTMADRLRLDAAATFLVRNLNGYCAEDLFQEAILRALTGARRYPPLENPDCEFVPFLFGTMKSISSGWKHSPYESTRTRDQRGAGDESSSRPLSSHPKV